MVRVRSFRSKLPVVLEGAFFVGAFVASAAFILASPPHQPEQRPAEAPVVHLPVDALPPSSTFIVVSSEAYAAELRTSIDEGNNVRHALGLDPTREVVLVAVDQQAALTLVAALEEGNRVLAAFGTEDRVVNATS